MGYVYYNELGNRIRVDPINNRNAITANELSLDFTQKKELSEEMKKEKEQAEREWFEYEHGLNKSEKEEE